MEAILKQTSFICTYTNCPRINFTFQFALHVYSNLVQAGEKYGMRHAGHYATRSLRVEKFYAFWGQDLDTRTTPLECGRMWRVKFDVS